MSTEKNSGKRVSIASSHLSLDNGSSSRSHGDSSFYSCNEGDSDGFSYDEDEAYDSIFKGDGNHHSLPDAEGLKQNLSKSSPKVKNNKTMQTIAGVAGNILEWYDFAVFGYLSDVIGDVFFPPNQEGHAAIIESFAVFGLAFLCRPIGGLILGYIGDTYGRKRALEISIFLMAFPTFAMGCLPSYERVGNWSIVFLTLVRMLQGLSVGGQLVSSLVYTCENNPKGQWGLYGSFVMAAANLGTLLGSIISYCLRANLTDEQLHIWGWRIPFLSGILVSLCGFYLRYYSDDDAIDHHHGGTTKSTDEHNPTKAAFAKGNRKILISASLVPMLWAGGFYIWMVWLATFMGELLEPPVPGAFGVNASALFFSVCILFPFAGILSDMLGRFKVMLTGGLLLGIFSPVMIMIISSGNPTASFFAQSTMGIALSLWGAPMCSWLVESFPPAIRLTSVAVGYNIAQAIGGGLSPALATYLNDTFGSNSVGFLISVISIFSVFGLCIAPKPEETTSYEDVYNDDDDEEEFEDVRETELT